MANAIMVVETRPKDPERADEYRRWYEDVHLEEVVTTGGFLSARHLEPVDGDGPFIAIFEIADGDLDALRARVASARENRGDLSPSQADVVAVRFYRELASHVGGSS